MVNINRLEGNLNAYVLESLVPRMPVLPGVAFATAASFVIRAKMKQYLPLFEGTEVLDGESVNVEALYSELKKNFNGKWPLEMGGFTFKETDLDEIYKYALR